MVPLTRTCRPLRVVPWPTAAANSSSNRGSSTTPTTGSLSTSTPMEIENPGWPYTKSVVPSIGSTTHRMLEVPSTPVPSSPRIESPGRASRIRLTIWSSDHRSTSVTKSLAVLLVDETSTRPARRPISGPTARAMSSARSRSTAWSTTVRWVSPPDAGPGRPVAARWPAIQPWPARKVLPPQPPQRRR